MQRITSLRPVDPKGWVRFVVVVVVVLFVVVQVVRIARFDYRTGPLVGDQASHLLQALSFSDGLNLNFDSNDIAEWQEVGWTETPRGVFFQQSDSGYSFSKPYGYSVWLSPFVFVLGPVSGVAFANAALVVLLVALGSTIIHRRFGWDVSFVASVVFVFGSSAYLFAYVIHPDVFLATLTGIVALLLLRLDERRTLVAAVLLGLVVGFAVSEKPPLVFAYGLGLAAVVWRARSRRLTGTLAAGLVLGWLIAVVPYLVHSDFDSWNPYAGDRYYSADGDVPFDLTPESSSAWKTEADRYFSVSYVTETISEHGRDTVGSTLYAVIGRHTGMLPFMPLGLGLLVLALRRRGVTNLLGVAVVAGLLGYLAFYLILFPLNYFGGAQTIGNRYLLQVLPLALLLAPLGALTQRSLIRLTAVAVVASMFFLGPHHRDPERSFWLLSRVSIAQQLLPFEHDRIDDIVFACGTYELEVIVDRGSDLCHEVFGIEVDRVLVEQGG